MYRERQKGIKKLYSEFLHEKLSLSHAFGGVLGRWLIKHLLFPRPLRERARVRGYITSAGCEVQPAQKDIAILQGQIGKDVQNDRKNSLLHVVWKRNVLKKEPPIAFLKLTQFAKNCGFPIGETAVLFPLQAGETTKWRGKGEVLN